MPKHAKSDRVVPGLGKIELLTGLHADEMLKLTRACAWRRVRGGQQIVSRQAKDRDVFAVVAGRVRVTSYSASGRQVTFRDVEAGDIFGDIAAIDGAPRSADVVALEHTLVACMPAAAFLDLVRSQPAIADRMLRRLAMLVRDLTERVLELSTLGVQNRVQADLLRRARQAGIRGNMARIDPAPRHADIASQVSTYREQVTRELSALVKAGLLARERNALVVRDVASLERLVESVRLRA